MPDAKALRILFDTYWSAAGWKDNPRTPKEDLEYATAAGLMFPPVWLDHDGAVAWLVRVRDRVEARAAAAAFLASLSTRRLDLRSALGSFAVARHLPAHRFAASPVFRHDNCAVCGASSREAVVDLNVLNFERFKWGGVRRLDVEYLAFDLERFLATEPLAPTHADRRILSDILAKVGAVPGKGRSADLEKAIAPLLPSNKQERLGLLEVLSCCGALQPRGQPSFLTGFIPHDERAAPPRETELHYPLSLWGGADGVCREAVEVWFPDL